MLSDDDLKNLKRLLESEHKWPSDYLFKFIVPTKKLNEVEALFPDCDIQRQASKYGNHISVSVTLKLESADFVIAIYQQASKIQGLISL